jgi:hypothetical protein
LREKSWEKNNDASISYPIYHGNDLISVKTISCTVLSGNYISLNKTGNIYSVISQVSLIACPKAFISRGFRRTLSAPQLMKCSMSEGSPGWKISS